MAKNEKNEGALQVKLKGLVQENEARVAQVTQWNENITQLRDEIGKAKEAHDYCRGQIEMLQQLITEEKGE